MTEQNDCTDSPWPKKGRPPAGVPREAKTPLRARARKGRGGGKERSGGGGGRSGRRWRRNRRRRRRRKKEWARDRRWR